MGMSFSGLDETRQSRRDPRWQRHIFLGLRHKARLDLNNANARALLALLGLDAEDACGSVTLPDARRAVMRARASFDRRAHGLTREPSESRGPARVVDGEIRRGVHVFMGGLDSEGLRDRLERFAALVEVLSCRGATRITWG